MSTSTFAKPFEVLSREINARIDECGKTRHEIIAETGIKEGTLKAICVGNRAIPDKDNKDRQIFEKLVQCLSVTGESIRALSDFFHQINQAGASIVNLLRGGRAVLKIGYLNSPPFALESRKGQRYPNGLIIEILEQFFQLLRINWSWHRIDYNRLVDSLESRQVDIVAGYILESPSRQARAYFIPHDMPFALGVNAISKSPDMKAENSYQELQDILSGAKGNKKFNIITINGEVADEYFPALFPQLQATIREENRNVEDTIHYYLNEDSDKEYNIVFADHMSCVKNLPAGGKMLLKKQVGRFHGGFLLPIHDIAWSEYFQKTYLLFLKSRLPQLGTIFTNYQRELRDFVTIEDCPIAELSNSSAYHGFLESGFWTLSDWLRVFWPREIDIPESFIQKIKNT